MRRTGITTALVIIIAILIVGIGFYSWMRKSGSTFVGGIEKDSGSNISDYSAVFLTNGQVYFGKVYGRSTAGIDLRDIYYLQVNQQVQPAETKAAASPSPSPEVSLVKLGNELHGPNDRMQINMSQVLFTESLKNDSKVVKAIADYKAK